MSLPKVITLILLPIVSTLAIGHGDVTTQPVNTDDLPALGDQWLEQNPWRDPENPTWHQAIAVGDSAYNQNCARCHGLEAVSGGLAPDLRMLSADWDGDEWYVERFRNGATQGGITKMPPYDQILNQEAAWAIRTYLETRPADGALDQYSGQLRNIRDTLQGYATRVANGEDASAFSSDLATIVADLEAINLSLETASGAPRTESVVSRSLAVLDQSSENYAKAAETLSIGLSAAR